MFYRRLYKAITMLKALKCSLEKRNINYIILSDSLSPITSIADTHNPKTYQRESILPLRQRKFSQINVDSRSLINKRNKNSDLLTKNTASTVFTGNMAYISAQALNAQ